MMTNKQTPLIRKILARAAIGCVAVLVLLAVALFLYVKKQRHRDIDPFPVMVLTPDVLPAGKATAKLSIDTGGDQMSAFGSDPGLALEVRFQNKIYWQVLASCKDIDWGNKQAGDLSAYDCDGRTFHLVSENNAVKVFEIEGSKPPILRTAIALPKGIRRAIGIE